MSPKQEKPVKREVKKEEYEEDDTPLSHALKAKKKLNLMNGSPRTKPAAKVKKEEPKSDEDDEDYEEETKPTIKKADKKVEKDKKMIKKIKEEEEKSVKKKKEAKSVKKKKIVAVAAAVADKEKKKEKKVYDLPGQKHDPPEERDPLRIFYETLYKQLPGSEMAAFWMMEWGLLPPEVARKVYEKKLKKGQQQKFSSPVKAVSVKRTTPPQASVKKNVVSKTVSKTSKKRKPDNSSGGEDDDFSPIKKKAKKEKGAK